MENEIPELKCKDREKSVVLCSSLAMAKFDRAQYFVALSSATAKIN
jgi:hypothetical protein